MSYRRYKIYKLGGRLLVEVLRTETPCLPRDARFVRVKCDEFDSDKLLIIVESDEFEPVPEGGRIPEYTGEEYEKPQPQTT